MAPQAGLEPATAHPERDEATLVLTSDSTRSVSDFREVPSERLPRVNVFGARLRITSLHVSHGPGVELLEYLAPRNGRPIPVDQRANDIAHWQTTLAVE